MSNAKNYQPEFSSIFTGGPANDHFLQKSIRQGIASSSAKSAQENYSFKFSRHNEKPVSEGHFYQKSQQFLSSNAVRITEENSGGDDNTTNKSPDAHEEATGDEIG